MSTLIIAILCSFVLLALAFAGIAVKILLKRHGEFKRHCATADPYTGERSGCICGKTIDDNCPDNPNYHPLEVNKELLDEMGR